MFNKDKFNLKPLIDSIRHPALSNVADINDNKVTNVPTKAEIFEHHTHFLTVICKWQDRDIREMSMYADVAIL